MSQPPAAEPPQDRPDDGGPETPPPAQPPQPPPDAWQPPGPATSPLQGGYPPYPAPYGAPPPGPQNPYGGGTTEVYRPIDSGGMSSTLKVVLGLVIGLVTGGFVWFFAIILILSTGTEDNILFVGSVAPLLVPAPLLIWRATRPWAVGLLAGTALVSVGLSGLCSSLLDSGSAT